MTELPVAASRPRSRFSFWWLLPLLAVALSLWLAWQQRGETGPRIVVQFDQGHGLKAGDALKHRGIDIGRVERIVLTPDLAGVEVELALQPAAAAVARAGSRFWIVRPQLAVDGVSGLDTFIGARYLQVQPGDGAAQSRFDGLAEPPTQDLPNADGLVITLFTPGNRQLKPGLALRYRGIEVGQVLDVRLSPDASEARARLRVAPEYAGLVRDNAQFWLESGARLSAGLTGLAMEVGSLSSLVSGGIAFAVPPRAGAAVAKGHQFRLHDEPEPSWLQWRTRFPGGRYGKP